MRKVLSKNVSNSILKWRKVSGHPVQGDLCNSDEICFVGISLKVIEVQSSIIVQKKRNDIAFYLVPGTWDWKIGPVVFSLQSKA